MLIQSDYHIHASFYRAKNPGDVSGPVAAEQRDAARAAGNKYIGILEHCNASPRHPFHCLEELSAEYYSDGFDRDNIFLGVEADLADDGSDACGDSGRKHLKLHYVIGSVHLSPKIIPDVYDYIDTEYRRITNALKYNDNVNIIGHPFGEGIRYERAGVVEKWGFDLIPEKYLEEIIMLAKNSGKALEINRCHEDDPVYVDFLKKWCAENICFTVGSDAHFTENTDKAALRTRWAEELGFKEENHWRIEK